MKENEELKAEIERLTDLDKEAAPRLELLDKIMKAYEVKLN